MVKDVCTAVGTVNFILYDKYLGTLILKSITPPGYFTQRISEIAA